MYKKKVHSQKSNHWIFNDHNCLRKNSRTDSEAKHFPDAHQDILAQEHDIREASISILNDNTPAVSRATKCLVTLHDTAAYLLWISSLHQHHFHYNVDFQHISGSANAMADDGSHLFKLSDAPFLPILNSTICSCYLGNCATCGQR